MRRMSITNPMDILRDRFMRANKRNLILKEGTLSSGLLKLDWAGLVKKYESVYRCVSNVYSVD